MHSSMKASKFVQDYQLYFQVIWEISDPFVILNYGWVMYEITVFLDK